MYNLNTDTVVVFSGEKKIASGELKDAVRAAKVERDSNPAAILFVFHAVTSHPIEIDFRGSVDDVLGRLNHQSNDSIIEQIDGIGLLNASPGPGRPKLGVVAHEVTLLPRHWEWLKTQPGGASVALRKLVEDARRANADKDRIREARESCYRFISVMAGDLVGFEEASRALFAGNLQVFNKLTELWPGDIQEHANSLAGATANNSASS